MLKFFEDVRASYWFVPSIMALFSIALGAGMVWLDVGPGADWLSGIGWYQSAKPDGAQLVLSAIAGSMITVAGVVFSITIVAIAYAASQYGPRVLTNFMSDRGNQVTLGTFIGTFVYCIVVLRTIRGGDGDASFVPQMAVMVGLLLALCSIGVLIYFIHHVPQSIHLNNVVAHIGRQLIDAVGDRFPAFIGDSPGRSEDVKDFSREAVAALKGTDPGGSVQSIRAEGTGYIQAVEEERLMKAAIANDIVLRLRYGPGEYLHRGRVLAEAWPKERVTEKAVSDVLDTFRVGAKRTPVGDFMFLIDELVEIAGRALSSGVNDPYTAISCIDWLGSGLSEVARRRMPSPARVDRAGKIRVLAQPQTFAELVERAFGRLRQYVARDMNAALHMLATILEVAADCTTQEQIEVLADEADRLTNLAQKELSGAACESVCRRAEELKLRLRWGGSASAALEPERLGGQA